MNILMVSSESVPFFKTGGLADVVGALSPVLSNNGYNTKIILPAYNMKLESCGDLVCEFSIDMLGKDERVQIYQKEIDEIEFLFVCHPLFNGRTGIYGENSFSPYLDNFYRFSLFNLSCLEYSEKSDFSPDIIHCHDWTTGLIPYLLKIGNYKKLKKTKTVFTIHNLAYQGSFPKMHFLFLKRQPNPDIFNGNQVNMLKAGIEFSDFLTTVSPTYSKEIQTKEQGCELDEIIKKHNKKLAGIVNGIDIEEWNPEKDPNLVENYNAIDIAGKAKNKEAVQKQFGLSVDPNIPLFSMISRIADQKGFDILLNVIEDIAKLPLQLLIIGTGDKDIVNKLIEIGKKHSNISINILFSNKLAHLVEAGSDFFLMPSKFEPCGLNQLYSLRYGTIPVARKTGGIADTVIDLNKYPEIGTGFLFTEPKGSMLLSEIKKAVAYFNTSEYNEARRRAMEENFSWKNSAKNYINIYSRLKGGIF